MVFSIFEIYLVKNLVTNEIDLFSFLYSQIDFNHSLYNWLPEKSVTMAGLAE